MNPVHLKITCKNERFPTFQKPTIVGVYSLDMKRTYHSSADNLKYLYRTPSGTQLDLNQGFDIYQQKVDTLENEEKIDALLSWLISSQYLNNIFRPEMEKRTFVCYRGLLTTVMRTPYENMDDWCVCATKVKNSIFLCAFNTDAKKQKIQRGMTPKEKLFEFYGRKFEQYMLSDSPSGKPDLTRSVNANEEFDLVYRSKLNEHYLIYGAEIDGIDSSTPVDTDISYLNRLKYVELKTSRIIQNRQQRVNFEKFKLIKWWSQSFMVGIESIICGFRDDQGIVKQIHEFKTRDLPKISEGLWSACVCFSFLEDFLSFVEDSMKNDDDFSTWKFSWKPGNNRVQGEKIVEPNTYDILPTWFKEALQNQ